MKVKCICKEASELKLLTLNKIYDVVKVLEREWGNTFYFVMDDEGELSKYYSYRFEIIKEEKEMKEFLNENKRQFKDLTDEEKLLIINEKMKGNVEYTLGDVWCKASDWEVRFDYVYRTKPKPAKKLDIPWKFIKPEFKWAAMDEDGEIYLYEEKPECKDGYFYSINCMSLIDILKIDTTGVDWKTSLTQRPEGV